MSLKADIFQRYQESAMMIIMMTLDIKTLSIKDLFATLSINDINQNNTQLC
jgi:hypothetical protein